MEFFPGRKSPLLHGRLVSRCNLKMNAVIWNPKMTEATVQNKLIRSCDCSGMPTLLKPVDSLWKTLYFSFGMSAWTLISPAVSPIFLPADRAVSAKKGISMPQSYHQGEKRLAGAVRIEPSER